MKKKIILSVAIISLMFVGIIGLTNISSETDKMGIDPWAGEVNEMKIDPWAGETNYFI